MSFLGNAQHGYSWVVSATLSAGTTEVIAAEAGKLIIVDKIIYSCESAGTMKLTSASTDITNTFHFGANGGVALDELRLRCGQNEALKIVSTDSGDHSIMVRYYKING